MPKIQPTILTYCYTFAFTRNFTRTVKLQQKPQKRYKGQQNNKEIQNKNQMFTCDKAYDYILYITSE